MPRPTATMNAWRQSRYGGPEDGRARPGARTRAGEGRSAARGAGGVRQLGRHQGHARGAAPGAAGLRAAAPARGDPRDGCRGHGRRARSRGHRSRRRRRGHGGAAGRGARRLRGRPGVATRARGPTALAPAEAAALPVAAGTAWQALESAGVGAGRPRARHRSIRRSRPLRGAARRAPRRRGVGAVRRAQRDSSSRELGAVRTFDYRTTDAADLPDASFDAVLDIAGAAPLRALRRLVRPAGSLVLVSGEGSRFAGPIGRILRGILLSLTPGPRVKPLAAVAKSGRHERAGRARRGGAPAPGDRAHVPARRRACGARPRRRRSHGRARSWSSRSSGRQRPDMREWMPACPSRPFPAAVP